MKWDFVIARSWSYHIDRNHVRVFLFCAFSLAATTATASADSPSTLEQEKLWNSRGCVNDQRGQWFREAKFGAFIHFGLYSELGGYWKGKPYDPAEQIIGLGQRRDVIPVDEYQREVGGAFNPTNFNAAEWVRTIKEAGQKYLIVTAKHHDGFCMFKTATTHYNVVEATPFGRDVIKELADECKKQGIIFCPYYSIGDWCADQVQAPRFHSYRDYMYAQLQELLTQYGDIRLLWFDNWWYVNNQWKNDEAHAKELYGFVRSLKPTVLVNDRCGRGANSTDGDYGTPENQLKGSLQSRYFEVVMTDTADDNWGWVRTATNYRRPEDLIRNLIDCASKGGNFVLNVGPTASGEFPAEHRALLKKIGAWMAVNGECIYATEPAPECQLDPKDGLKGYATRKGNTIYIEVSEWPTNDEPTFIHVKKTGLFRAELLDATLGELRYTTESTGGTTVLKVQKPLKRDPYATVLKLSF